MSPTMQFVGPPSALASHIRAFVPSRYWPFYARRFGFRGAFFHPQRILAHAMARLPAPPSGEEQRLEVWLKGPVYYGARVALKVQEEATGLVFALHADGDIRPAIVARWSTGLTAPASTLEPASGREGPRP